MRPIALGRISATWSTVLMNCCPGVMLNFSDSCCGFSIGLVRQTVPIFILFQPNKSTGRDPSILGLFYQMVK